MDGTQDAQKRYLKEAAATFAFQIRTSKCTKIEALYTYNSSCMKTMEYCIPVARFSETEWNKIVS